MPNHFHLALWPHEDGDLSRWMQWLLTAHVRRYHHHYGGSGHVWQGRFKAFPIQQDEHLLTVLRYVERSALRAGLVRRAEDWPWGSRAEWGRRVTESVLHQRPRGWTGWKRERSDASLFPPARVKTDLMAVRDVRPCSRVPAAAVVRLPVRFFKFRAAGIGERPDRPGPRRVVCHTFHRGKRRLNRLSWTGD